MSVLAAATNQAELDLALWQGAMDRLDRRSAEFSDAVGIISVFISAMRNEGSHGPLGEYAWRRAEKAMADWGMEVFS